MSQLDSILTDPNVEIVESVAEFDESTLEHWLETVENRENRAVAGIIRDDADRVLLARRPGEAGREGWRLPGSEVGRVTDFDERIRTELTALLGAKPADVTPRRVHKHTARSAPEPASYFYVLYDVEIDQSAMRTDPPGEVELRWAADRPDSVVNGGVMDRLFDDAA